LSRFVVGVAVWRCGGGGGGGGEKWELWEGGAPPKNPPGGGGGGTLHTPLQAPPRYTPVNPHLSLTTEMPTVALHGYSEVSRMGFLISILPYLGHSIAQVQLPLQMCPDSGQSNPKFLTHLPMSPAVQGN